MSRRIHKGALQGLERPVVSYITPRISAEVTPDQLSALAVVGATTAGAGLVLCWFSPWFLLAAAAGLAANWFGDSFDGAIARYRRRQRPRAGFLIDKCGDVLSFCIMIVGLGLSPYLSLRTALMLLVGYLVHAIYGLMRLAVDGVQYVGLGGIGATEVRLLIGAWAGASALMQMDLQGCQVGGIAVADLAGGALLAGALALFARQVASDVRRMSNLDNGPGFAAGKSSANLRVVQLGAGSRANAAKETAKDGSSAAPVS